MLFLRKLFKLPSPVDLGRSKWDALPSRDFTPECTSYTWEDWHDEVKSLHPVRYFIAETFGDFLLYQIWFPVSRPFKKTYRWLVSHLIPSRRYHMLDLRQPHSKHCDSYQYGWQDVPEKMLYAMFNLLKEWFDENPYDISEDHSMEEINADPVLLRQYTEYQEAKAILHWWQFTRKYDYKEYNQMLHDWSELRSVDYKQAEKLFKELNNFEEQLEKNTDDMVTRLMKIRRGLWT